MTMQYNGLYPGIVADNKDPKRLGRVKARVGILGDAFTSHWLLPAGCVAGPDCGGFYPPPVGAGVVVSFIEGDLENGWYLGGFWAEPGKKNEVPKPFQRTPPTNQGYQSPKGHLLEFDDLPASAGIRLTSKGKRKILLDDAQKRVVVSSGNADITLDPQGGLSATSSGKAKITLDPQGGLSATSSGKARVQLDPQGTATVQSAAGVKAVLDQGVTLSLPNGAKVAIGAKGDIQLKDPSGKVSLTLNNGTVTIAAATVKLKALNVNIDAPKVAVGKAAALHPALAESLATLFNTHTHGTPAGPSTPPAVPMLPAAVGSATVTVAK